MYKIFSIIIIILLATIFTSCKTITLLSADGKENESCYVDRTCNKGLICNNENICVKEMVIYEETDETVTTNMDQNKNNQNNYVDKEEEKKEEKVIKKEDKKVSSRKLGSKCSTVNDCDSKKCLKYQSNQYQCTKSCREDKDCGDMICHDWLKLCVPFN